MIKLFATDIDHTLYSSELDLIPEENIKAIRKLMDRGVTIALASSRGFDGILPVVDQLGLREHNGYGIVHNGAYVVRLSDGKVLANEHFSPEEIAYLYEKSKKLNVGFSAMQGNFIYSTDYSDIIRYDFEMVDMDVLLSKNIMKFLHGDICQLSYFDDKKNVYELINEIDEEDREKYNFNCAQSTVMDISLKYVNKYFGLQKVMDDLGISGEEVAATGDNDNDAPMLQAARISGCVANGSQLAKESADYIVKSDAEAGVAQFINEYLLGEGNV